jgi:hypothetical protein
MKLPALRLGVLALACLLTSACHDRPEPAKPITGTPLVCWIDY